MTIPAFTPVQQAILNALAKGDRNQGELLDETGCSSYAELNAALKSLQSQNRIAYYFTPSPAVLMYKLAPQPVLGWFQRDI